jgi:hypothetical protein
MAGLRKVLWLVEFATQAWLAGTRCYSARIDYVLLVLDSSLVIWRLLGSSKAPSGAVSQHLIYLEGCLG